MERPNSILIIKLSAIGDVVHSLPFLEVLKEKYTGARIDWVVEEGASQIVKGHPALDRVFVSRRKSWQKNLVKGPGRLSAIREIQRFVRELRLREYDLVIDLQGLFKSGILTGLCRGKRKVGMEGAREGGRVFLNERPVSVNYDQHAIDRYLQIAGYLKCDSTAWKGKIPVFDPDRRQIDYLLKNNGSGNRPLIAINPMAKWETKLWEEERFAGIADRLKDELSCEVIFTGSRQDREVIERILKMMKKRPMNLAGQTSLKELACLYERCGAVVTTDTGPMHIAAAMGCQVVALFGPTAPWRTGPYGNGHRVIRAEIECSPCFKKRCDNTICMKEITVEAVFEAVRDIIK